MTKEQLFTFIKDHKLAVLSTISAQGAPQSALIGIAVTAELEIVFDTVKSSRKYGNLATNPAATFVVGCTSETTLQYEGVASEPLVDDLGALPGGLFCYLAGWSEQAQLAGDLLLVGEAEMDQV